MVVITTSERNRFDYKEWEAYFRGNDAGRLKIDFSQEKALPQKVKKLIFPSIRAFQKGEGSDGGYLMKTVNAFAEQSGEADYPDAMRQFVKEENWHSAYLKTYMEFHGVESAKRSVLDAAFRRLRKLGGLKCEVTILVTAEMIALSYYDALSNCTESAALKSICAQMLQDELPHIVFQSYTLRHFRVRAADKLARYVLMDVTSFLVWCAYHRVFRAGGYGFRRFFKENRGYLRQSIQMTERKPQGKVVFS